MVCAASAAVGFFFLPYPLNFFGAAFFFSCVGDGRRSMEIWMMVYRSHRENLARLPSLVLPRSLSQPSTAHHLTYLQ